MTVGAAGWQSCDCMYVLQDGSGVLQVLQCGSGVTAARG